MGNNLKLQMKFFAAAIIGFASANVDTKFMEYVSTHNKSYGTVEEYRFRLAQFAEADALIEDHNSQNGSSFTLGHNKMSDWTSAEYKRLLGYKPLSFSEQQLVDCVTLCFGCNGGNFTTVFSKYATKHGMFLEKDWPYKAVNGNCSQETPTTAQPTTFMTSGAQAISTNSVDALKGGLEQGPVSVAIQADEKLFSMYQSGVF